MDTGKILLSFLHYRQPLHKEKMFHVPIMFPAVTNEMQTFMLHFVCYIPTGMFSAT